MTNRNRFLPPCPPLRFGMRGGRKDRASFRGYIGGGTSGALRPMFRPPQLHYHPVISMECSPARAGRNLFYYL